MAFDNGELHLQSTVKIRLRDVIEVDNGAGQPKWEAPEGWTPGEPLLVETTLGRVIFNETLPPGYRFVNYEIRKGQLSAIVNDLAERFPKVALAATLDALKEAGFHWATWSGVTIGMGDVIGPPRKPEILARYQTEADRIDKQYQRGLMTAEERRGELIEIWTKATNEISKEMEIRAAAREPALGDDQLGRSRQPAPAPADRGDPWPGGQPQGRDHPAADHVVVPRGSDRAGVLHLHARRP